MNRKQATQASSLIVAAIVFVKFVPESMIVHTLAAVLGAAIFDYLRSEEE